MECKPPNWVYDTVFYQIFPDRFYNGDPSNDSPNVYPWGELPTRENFFGGDLLGILKKIDYLEDLGVNCLYLTPIFKASSNHKYDTVNYYEIDPHFGDMETLKALVRELHRRGMRIILDGVFNHCGFEHPFFQDAVEKGPKSEYWDWFIIDGFPITQQPEPNYRCFAGVPAMPELNTNNPKAREYLLDIVKYWIKEADIDGWRLDTVEYLDPGFVKEIRYEAKRAKDDVYIVGEVMGIGASWIKGGCLDGVMNYKLRDLLVKFFATEEIDAQDFSKRLYSLRRSYPDWANTAMFNLLGSHDTPRFLTLCGGDVRKMKLAIGFLFTYPGAPVIYYGDEVGMEGGGDPDCRRPFVWDRDQQDLDLLNFYRHMIRLRKEKVALRRGEFKTLYENKGIYSFARRLESQIIVVIFNNSNRDERVRIPLAGLRAGEGIAKDLLKKGDLLILTDKIETKISAYDLKLLELNI